jgi:hypothetical protein
MNPILDGGSYAPSPITATGAQIIYFMHGKMPQSKGKPNSRPIIDIPSEQKRKKAARKSRKLNRQKKV